MLWDLGLAILGVYRIPPRVGRGSTKGDPWHQDSRHKRVEGTPKIGRRSVEVLPRSGILQKKSIPKSRLNLERLLDAKMLPKASHIDPGTTKNHQQINCVFERVFDPILHRILLDDKRPPKERTDLAITWEALERGRDLTPSLHPPPPRLPICRWSNIEEIVGDCVQDCYSGALDEWKLFSFSIRLTLLRTRI